jgi:HEAT repeat protein/cyclophilin family peptidyl-prolyl cis-trans isomerase
VRGTDAAGRSSRHLSRIVAILLIPVAAIGTITTGHGQPARPPLSPADVDAIAEILMLEDTRRFDEEALTRLLASSHPEVKRRAVVAVGRIVNERGRALLAAARGSADPELAATVVFATGQLKDPGAVSWLGGLLSTPATPPAIGREAAIALGKIRTPEARAALASYLANAPVTPASGRVAGEALLAIGRFTGREDLTPVVRWIAHRDAEVRWRAAWALFRPRDPAAIPHLMTLAGDPSADVRFWAVRGLVPPAQPGAGRAGRQSGAPPAAAPEPATPPPPAPPFDRAAVSARVRAALEDSDLRVRTEAVRALVNYDDDESVAALIAALDSRDSWVSVSAAEALANARFQSRASQIVPRLVAAAAPGRSSALRNMALTPLVTLAPESAVGIASALAKDPSAVIRGAARQALGRLGDPGRAALEALDADPAAPAAAPPAGGRGATPTPPPTLADYRRVVERWIVPDYNGAPKPRVVWETTRGTFEIELYPGDAPLGVDYFMRAVEAGDIVGTEFGRLVPNFVAQQRPVRNVRTLRDEVNRRGLTRGNVSWASSGLDTGRPGYTLATAPHPHIEGDFTAVGRIASGMDVVDRLEFGDAVTRTRVR